MRFAFSTLAAISLASTAVAQMPLPPPGNFFTAGATRGIYFQCPINCFVTGLSVPDITNPIQVIEFIDFGLTAPPFFTASVIGTQMFYDNNTPAQSIIPVALPLVAGNYYGVLGCGNASVGSTTSQNPYSTQTGTFTSNILGLPTDIFRLMTQTPIGANGGNSFCSAEAAGTISRVEVYVSSTGGGTIATNTVLGEGCISQYASFYEQVSTAAFDLTDTDITGTNTGAGYLVLTNAGSGPLPVGGVDPLGGTVLVLGDDNQVAAGTLGMSVGSNGWMARGAGNSNAFSPTAATMLSNPSETVYTWTDLQPNTSGTVTYEEDVATGQTRVTYDGVNGWQTPNPVFIQIDYNVTTGDWAIRFGVVGFANPEDWLVGYSPAGANADPGSIDISANPVIVIADSDIIPLSLAANTRPVLGTNWDLTVNDIPASTVFGVTIFGTVDPMLLDLGFLGMPSCQLRSTLDVVDGPWTPAGPSHAYSFAVPATPPSLVGIELFTQAATFGLPTVNAFGAITSNGIKGTLGDL